MLLESDASRLNLEETELTLALPGGSRTETETSEICSTRSSGNKRAFSETVDASFRSSLIDTRGTDSIDRSKNSPESQISLIDKLPPSKAQLVGWPPVRSFRTNALKICKYVKVAVDGAPYLRKVDLEMFGSYQQLLGALEEMFTCFTIFHSEKESNLMDSVNEAEYVATYEDREGDWMLAGDVPWKMFVESCKRVRLMKMSDAIGLAPLTTEECTSSR